MRSIGDANRVRIRWSKILGINSRCMKQPSWNASAAAEKVIGAPVSLTRVGSDHLIAIADRKAITADNTPTLVATEKSACFSWKST
jgi:hypothetical protein